MIFASVYGRAGVDPVKSVSKSGKEMTRLSIVLDVTPSNATDQESLWVSILAFGKTAETLARASKVEMLSCQGRLTRGRYIAKSGEERESWSMVADAAIVAKSARPPGRKASSAPTEQGRQVDFDDPIGF